MRLVNRSTIFAYCGTMLITNPGTPLFRGECPEPTADDSRRGFLYPDARCIFFYVNNHIWRAPVSVFLADSPPPDFGDADRVLRFPISVTGEELLVGGIMYGPDEWRRIRIPSGDYSLYWLGYNIHKREPSDEHMDLDLEDYALLTDEERYDFVLVPGSCSEVTVLRGDEYLYERTSA